MGSSPQAGGDVTLKSCPPGVVSACGAVLDSTGARQVHCDGYERLISQRSAMRPILNTTTVRHFLHWLPGAPMPSAVKLPLPPMRMRPPRACQLCRWLSSSLLPRTAAPSLSGVRAKRAAFPHSARSSSSIWRPALSSRGSASPTTCCLVRRRCDISLLLFMLRHFSN
jgi:hypothetical protein